MNYDHKAALEEARKELEEKNKIQKTSDVEENVTEENSDSKTLELSTGEVIIFDLDYLTGKTILNIKNEFRRKFKDRVNLIDELDDTYCTFVAAKLSNKTFEELGALQYKDWAKVKNFVKDYLLEV